jgi:ribonuclease Z
MSNQYRLVFLGTGASVPSPKRNLPCLAIHRNGGIVLCDCSESAQSRIIQAGLHPSRIHTILISHLHGDHLFGLPGFLTSQQMMSRSNPIQLIGPAGLKKYIQFIQNISGFTIEYPLTIEELDSGDCTFAVQDLTITAKQLSHRLLPCYGFRLLEPDSPGKFDNEKATSLGIPEDSSRSELLEGKPITLANGKTIHPGEIIGPPHPGKIISYCTDTRPCDAAIELCRDSSVMLFDSTFSDLHTKWADETGHSTSRQAAQIAKRAKTGLLILWHISLRYNDEQEQQLLLQAREEFSNVILPQDFQSLDIMKANLVFDEQ